MALGQHWEWRGFGRVSAELQRHIQQLPPHLAGPWRLTDHYLWTPGCAVNVKLREGDLKLKRFVETRGELECWQEDEREIFPFPLTPEALRATAAALGLALPDPPPAPVHRQGLLQLAGTAQPPVQIVSVVKVRWLYQLEMEGETPVIVELAEITAPQRLASVALEHVEPVPVEQARRVLQVDAERLRPMSYLDALALWGLGKRLPGDDLSRLA